MGILLETIAFYNYFNWLSLIFNQGEELGLLVGPCGLSSL